MNLIVLCSDTYRVDYLSCYRADSPVATPHIDRLAAEGVLFRKAFGEGTPTLPARRVMYTGRRIFPFLWVPQKWDRVALPGWHPMFYEDVTLAEWLHEHGYVTGLISDLPHQFKPGKNFHRGFVHFDWVRGQEMDFMRSGPRAAVDVDRYLPPGKEPRALTEQSLMNMRDWRGEEDWCSAQVLQRGIEFVRDNAGQQPFMLWMEAFSPHEPWLAPANLVAKYLDGDDPEGPDWIHPPASRQGMTEPQAKRVRAHYAALCELIDRWFGRLMEEVERQGLLDDTIVVFLSDHGTMMGEQGQYHKGPDRLRWQVTQVPWIIRFPGAERAGSEVDAFVQHQDLMPTLLAAMGLDVPDRCTGRNLVADQLEADAPGPDHVVTSFGWYAAVRDRRYNYQAPWVAPDYHGLPERQRKLTPPQLYDLSADPDELHNIAAEHPDLVRSYHQRLLDYADAGRALTKGSLEVSEHSLEDVPLYDQSRL